MCIVFFLLIISIGDFCAADENNDAEVVRRMLKLIIHLTDEITESDDSLDLQHNHTFNNQVVIHEIRIFSVL